MSSKPKILKTFLQRDKKDLTHQLKSIRSKVASIAVELDSNLVPASIDDYALKVAAYDAYNSQRWDEALRYYHRLADKSDDPKLHHRIGMVLERSGRHEEALEYFLTLSDADPKNGELAYRAAVNAIRCGDEDCYSVMVTRALHSDKPEERYLDLAWDRLPKSTPNWRRLEMADQARTIGLDSPKWLRRIADYAWSMTDYERSAEVLRELEQKHSVGQEECFRIGLADINAGRIESGMKYLLRSIKGAGGNAAKIGPAVFAKQSGDYESALKLVEMVPGRGSESELMYERGTYFERIRSWKAAGENFAIAVVLDPGAVQALYKYGLALERQGEYQVAADAYRLCTTMVATPSSHHLYLLGRSLAALGQYEEASTTLLRAFHSRLPKESSVADRVYARLNDNTAETAREGIEDFRPVASLADESKSSLALRIIGDSHKAFSPKALGLKQYCDYKLGQLELSATASAEDFWELAPLLVRGDVERRVRLALDLVAYGSFKEAVEVLLPAEPFQDKDGLNPATYLKNVANARRFNFAENVAVLPICDKLVLWESNHGSSFGCHPLAMLRWMLTQEQYADFYHVIAVNDDNAVPEDLIRQPRVLVTRLHSDEYLHALSTAKYLVNNVSFAPYYFRRDGQKYLNTWHGTPMKTLGRSMRGKLLEYENLQRNFQLTTMIMAPNALTEWALIEDHDLVDNYRGVSVISGSPRLDTSVNMTAEARESIRSRLGLAQGDNRKLVLYAPTWRGGVSERELDVEALTADLSTLSSIEGCHLVFRAHRLSEKLVEESGLDFPIVPKDIDTNELLAAVDVLITDYSSILFDFMPQERPIIAYVPDLEEYRNTRGLYIEPEELVSLVAEDREALPELIASALEGAGKPSKDVKKYFAFEDGQASKRMVQAFFDGDLSQGIVRDYASDHGAVGKTSLVFHASLIPNGIASALVALLHTIDYSHYSVSLVVEPTVLRGDLGRAEIYSRIPEQVHVVCRVGGMTTTIRQTSLLKAYAQNPTFHSDRMMEEYWEAYVTETKRVLGDFVPDSAIEYDGYAELWVSFIGALGLRGSKIACYQHNTMRQELETKLPQLHRVFTLYKNFDKVISVSRVLADTNRKDLLELGYDIGDQITAAQNILDLATIRAKAAEPINDEEIRAFVESSDSVFVSIGRMSHEKNQRALIAAFDQYAEHHPGASLILVGSGLLYGNLQQQVKTSKHGDRILLTGQLSNPLPVLAAADCFVLPSLHEGQPVTILEAMTLGVPVVCSDIPGNAELVNQGYGLLCGTNPEEIAEALGKFTEDRTVAMGEFNPERYVRTALMDTMGAIV